MANMPRLKIYFAAPFFSQGEREFNNVVIEKLEDLGSVFYPYRDGLRMADLVAQGASPTISARQVWLCDFEQIRDCDLVIAVLDGRVPDEGVCVEIGLASGFEKAIVGVTTDSRSCFSWGANPMVAGCLSDVCTDLATLLATVRRRIDQGTHQERNVPEARKP